MKNLIYGAFVLLGLVFIYSNVNSAARGKVFVDKVYKNEGDLRVGLAVSVSSTSWATVLSSNVKRRHAILQNLSTASSLICLSTTTADGSICDSNVPGIRLEAGSSYDDYNEGPLYARVADGGSSETLFGMYFYDSGD